MATQPKVENQQATNSLPVQETEDDHVATGPSSVGLIETLEKQYHKIKEHAETYPYVWASYIVVYGGFGLWTAYRWRRLRKTEDRVRALDARLKQLVEAEESTSSTTVVGKGSASSGARPKQFVKAQESASATTVVEKGSASSGARPKQQVKVEESASSTTVVEKGLASSGKPAN